MIGALWRDAVRLLLRPIPLGCLVVLGALLGSLVAATRHSFHGELAGLDAGGASIQSLVSGLMLFASSAGLVFGLLLGNEDRASGFVALLAVRPVSRFRYATGRAIGLAVAAVVAALGLAVTAVSFAGFSVAEMPELREIRRPASVTIDGRPLARGDLTMLESGQEARFRFGEAGAFSGELRLEPVNRGGFSGLLDLSIRGESRGKVVFESVLDRARPLGSIAVEFADPEWVDGEIVVANRTTGAALVIGHESLRATGSRSPRAIQAVLAAWLLLLAAVVSASIGFASATVFSTGPAALTAGFLLLVGLAKSTVLDLAAASYPRFAPLLRLAPDLSRFDASESLGSGEALSWFSVAVATGAAAAWIVALVGFAAIALSWRDRT